MRNCHQRHPLVFVRSPAWRPAFERLDRALEKNTLSDNSEKIRLLRMAMFADVEKLQLSGKVHLPK